MLPRPAHRRATGPKPRVRPSPNSSTRYEAISAWTRSRWILKGKDTRMHLDQAVLTSLATLLGAGVGGVTTFMSSKAAFHRGETLETKRRHDALMRDASVRFVKILDVVQGDISSSTFKGLSGEFDELASSNQDVK